MGAVAFLHFEDWARIFGRGHQSQHCMLLVQNVLAERYKLSLLRVAGFFHLFGFSATETSFFILNPPTPNQKKKK